MASTDLDKTPAQKCDSDGNGSFVPEIIRRYDGQPEMLIPMMQDVQAEYGYLPETQLKELAARLQVPLSRIYSVATFYASFRLTPHGEHTIQLCLGTVCYLKGAGRISAAIQQQFDVAPAETSPDGKFTLAPVNCVGACALAPVMVVDGEYYGGLTVDSAVKLLQKIVEGKAPTGGLVEGDHGAKQKNHATNTQP